MKTKKKTKTSKKQVIALLDDTEYTMLEEIAQKDRRTVGREILHLAMERLEQLKPETAGQATSMASS